MHKNKVPVSCLNYGYDLPGLANAMDTTNSLQFICWVENGFYQ